MVGPGKCPSVYDHSTKGGPVPSHEFGERVDDNVGTVRYRFERQRGGHRVVDNQRYAQAMGHFSHRFEVHDITGRVANALAENGFGLGIY